VNSIVACCHSAKLCIRAARDFRSQQFQRILDVWQSYAESHGIIFNCNKTVSTTFKAKSAKSTANPLLKLGGQYVKSVDQYKYPGIVFDAELSDDKDIQRQLR